MRILEEKLDKEKLVNTIQKNPDDYHEFIHQCIRDGAIIPDKILNDYFKDHPLFSKKEDIPPTYINGWVPTLFTYAYFLLEKNIEIPEIILKAISRSSQYSNDLIAGFLNKKINVPEILITSVSLNPSYSYYSAVNFIKNNRKVPEILNQTIEKNPMILNTYEQFLREIEMEKKVKEAYAFKEVKESVIVNEKLDKEKLLNIAASDFDGSFNLINAVIDVDNPDKESIRQVLDNENVLKSFIDLERTLELTAKFSENDPTMAVRARVWYAIILILHNKKVPDALNQKIAKDEAETRHYYNYLKKHGLEIPDAIYNTYKKWIQCVNESLDKQIITEALDKEKLKQVFLKNPNAVVKYVIRTFLEKGVEPPEEFIEAISQGAYASKTYIDAIIHWTDKKVPQAIIQGVLKSSDIAFEIFQDPELKPHFSEEDLEKSIANNSSNALGLYKIYKKENKKIPMVIWKSITQSSTASLYLARDFVEARKTIPNQLLRGISTNVERLFIFSIELLKNNLDLPDVFLNALSQHADSSRVFGDFDKVLFQYVKGNKEIPQILLDAAANRAWRDKNLSGLCQDLASKGMKIPDAILDIFIKNTPKDGYGYIGGEALKIILYYLEKEAMTKFENIPTKLYKYILESGISNHIKILIEGFMKTFGKVPEEFKKAILDYHDKYSKREYIPKDIAKAIGINESAIIKEKLDKEKLLHCAIKQIDGNSRLPQKELDNIAIDLIQQLAYAEKNIPDILSHMVANRNGASVCARIAAHIIAYSKKDVPEALLERISTNRKVANDIAYIYANNQKNIPEIIKNVLGKKNKDFYNNFKGGEFFALHTMPFNESLDKDKLLNIVAKKPDDAFRLFWKTKKFKENPHDIPEKLKRAFSKNSEIAFEYAKHVDLHDSTTENIPAFIIKAIAKDAREAFRYAQHLIFRRRKVPKIILKGIFSHSFWSEKYNSFISDLKSDSLTDSRWKDYFKQMDDETINEALDKEKLLIVVGKNEEAYDQLLRHYFYEKKELPPKKIIDMASKNLLAARIYAEYCLETEKEIRPDVIDKIAEDPRSSYTIASLLNIENRDVPKVLIDSIRKDPLSLKHYKDFLSARTPEGRNILAGMAAGAPFPYTNVYGKI
jgi:hypothetical protein